LPYFNQVISEKLSKMAKIVEDDVDMDYLDQEIDEDDAW
jgi:hypothetical protein